MIINTIYDIIVFLTLTHKYMTNQTPLKVKNTSVDSKKIRFDFQIDKTGFLIGLCISLLVGVVCHVLGWTTIQESTAISALIIVTCTLWYHATNTHINITLNERKHDFDRKAIAVSMITEWYKDHSNNSVVTHKFINEYYFSSKERTYTEDDFIRVFDGESEDSITCRKAVIPILNYYEKMCVAILHEVADEQILRDYFESLFFKHYKFLYPVIKARRNEHRGGLADAFEAFTTVAERWGAVKKA